MSGLGQGREPPVFPLMRLRALGMRRCDLRKRESQSHGIVCKCAENGKKLMMTDKLDDLDEFVVASVITLGDKATLTEVREIIEGIGGYETTERALRPVLESLVSRCVLESLGTDRVAIPLTDTDTINRSWPQRVERARELLEAKA